jgi:peptidoglycan glycosyltransferase
LLNRALSNTYPPGSTFKVIVAAEALERGLGRGSVLPAGPTYTAPGTTTPVGNAPGVVCGDEITLENALRISCNTAFARFCVEQAGADAIKAEAREFGFESVPLIDRDDDNHFNVAPSHTGDITSPAGGPDLPALAQSCIGQRDVRWTPLQAALAAATIANDGVQMRPYLIETIQDANLAPLWHVEPTDLGRPPISSAVAGDLRQMMQAVVDNGTGRNARIEGFEVGGKTGTAQNDDAPNHGWFIGYARTSSGQPVVAVAVLIQNAGSGGSGEAAKIAGQVMEAALVAKSLK